MADSPAAPDPEPTDDGALLPPPGGHRAPVACRLCGRPLTGREARLRGIGDGCAAKLRERSAPRPPEREIEQDALPGV